MTIEDLYLNAKKLGKEKYTIGLKPKNDSIHYGWKPKWDEKVSVFYNLETEQARLFLEGGNDENY